MRVKVRYEIPRDFGAPELETRREYNLRFGQPPGPDAEVPYIGIHIWNWFWSLAGRKRQTEAGPEPLTWTELASWIHTRNIAIREEEIDALMSMDTAYISAQREESEAQQGRRQARAPKSKNRWPG